MKPLLDFTKKGQVSFGNLSSIIIVVGIAAVIGVVMSILIQNIRDDETTAGEASRNVSDNALGFFNNLADQWTLLGTVIGLVLVVTVVLAVFRFRGTGGGGI